MIIYKILRGAHLMKVWVWILGKIQNSFYWNCFSKQLNYQKKCVPYFVTSFSVEAAMLLIIVKQNVTLKFVSLNIWESLHVQTGKNIKSTKNYAVRDHILVCNNKTKHLSEPLWCYFLKTYHIWFCVIVFSSQPLDKWLLSLSTYLVTILQLFYFHIVYW